MEKPLLTASKPKSKQPPIDDPAARWPGELAIFYYAFAWRARPHIPPDARPFTIHKRSGFGDLIIGIGLAAVFEILPVHLLLHKRSAIAAWILTALSCYAAVWLVGLARSLKLRPTLVQPTQATIRLGLFFTLKIPARAIVQIGPEPRPGAVTIPSQGTPNVCIEFSEPLEAHRIFGLRKRLTSLAIAADDPEALTTALRLMAY